MLRELAYRAAQGRAARRVMARLGPAVRLPFGEGPPAPEPRRVLLVITVDTEGGYVNRSERRLWQGSAPLAFQGYVDGIRNVTEVLDRHGVKGTFFVAPHGRSATGATLAAVERAIRSIPGGGHEIGLHIHPSSDVALARRTGRSFASGRACDLAVTDLELLAASGRALLEELLEPRAVLDTVRWGNWALDERAAHILAAAGFRVDSSAVPGLRDRGARPRFDWTHARSTEPWSIVPGLLEVPIAMFRLFGRLCRADLLYGSLVSAALNRHASRAPNIADPTSPLVFVATTHSTEATYADGSPTHVVSALDALLAFARESPLVEVVTLREAVRQRELAALLTGCVRDAPQR